MGMKFDKYPLAVEKNTYPTKIVHSYIVYELNAYPKVPLKKFKVKKILVIIILI